MRKDPKEIQLSPSKLSLFLECPRCFYLQEKVGIRRPEFHFPSLPRGIDTQIKKYFDKNREDPSFLFDILKEENVELVRKEVVEVIRNWQKFFFTPIIQNTKINFCGEMDDCLMKKVNNKKIYHPIDFKTRGFPMKEDTSKLYQLQLDCYGLLLEKNNYPAGEYALILYFIPKELRDNLLEFDIEVEKVKIDPGRAYKTLEEAVKLLLSDELPGSNEKCGFCLYLENLEGYFQKAQNRKNKIF